MSTNGYRWRDFERPNSYEQDLIDSYGNNPNSPSKISSRKVVEDAVHKVNRKKHRNSQCIIKFSFARELFVSLLVLVLLAHGYFKIANLGTNQDASSVQAKSSLFGQLYEYSSGKRRNQPQTDIPHDDISKEFEYIDMMSTKLLRHENSTKTYTDSRNNTKTEEVKFDKLFGIREDSEFIETVEVAFNSLRYRRVCTSVGYHSVLCMTIRFPFEFPAPVKDHTIKRPVQPVLEDFYKLDIENMYNIMPKDWARCNNNSMTVSSVDDINIKKCLYSNAELIGQARSDKKVPVTVLWTRTKRDKYGKSATILHSVGNHDAVSRIYEYFGDDHEIVVMGASPAPRITESLHHLLGTNCVPTYVNKEPNYNCRNPKVASGYASRRLSRKLTTSFDRNFSTLQESRVNIGVIDYRSTGSNGMHELPLTVLETLQVLSRAPGWTELRNLTIIMEYPFAHIQTEVMIDTFPEKINELQTKLPSLVMDLKSAEGQLQLAKQGYRLNGIIVFDGLPQFYPTRTSGWSPTMAYLKQIDGIIKYPGNWTPEYGTNCVGPLPRHSVLRGVNDLSRRSFEQLHFDDRWYGRTWEFVNLFWWQMARCTYL
jgi:hypothetical protein